MLSAIPKSPWTRPLNWNLHVDFKFEPRIPFPFYIQPEPIRLPGPTFTQFCRLPTELQQRVLYFCDGPTLFQLMRVSSATRAEAENLFWSSPDAWYYVDAYWLFAGGFPGLTHYTLDFLAHVEQVEVDVSEIELFLRPEEPDPHTGQLVPPSQSPEELAHGFWQTLQHRFPRATHVVMSRNAEQKYDKPLPYDLKMMVQMCPTNITTSASLLQYDVCRFRRERSLWRLRGGDTNSTGEWEKISPVWTRQSILPPPKEFRGPVGVYEHIFYKYRRLALQEWALWPLQIEALERHYFDGRYEPFSCPDPTCEARFEHVGEWTLHAIDSAHDLQRQGIVLPNKVKAIFHERRKALSRKRHDLDEAFQRLFDDWGEEESEKRHNTAQAFLHQLEHDPLYAHGKPARECSTWIQFLLDMDPTGQRSLRAVFYGGVRLKEAKEA
ncbi:hypothetical protein K469DRAFT_756261 [Zopfia rhizophila CBS 207.26]|uniref:C2H2-type domain-containing protein n=1 Tax=Zopfia rhizophila CBS 207.26 TaxID=1314779 RepID=A0A6A6DCQ1_9PEZI|nr:hypothetical protein K469DRAFT_756261 [Zopfia rhizophila CBS 207.26]